MSYNQKPPGSSGSGMGGGPPNGPNNIPQVAKTFAGIQQQMQNLVHGQNAIPQSSQADINAFLQQQRIQNMLKQQQQFLQFQHQMQQQQHQQQQHQHHNMGGGGGVVPGAVGGVPGVGGVAGPGAGGAGGSGEPLALTRTAGATELLNKTYQQQANGNPTANSTFNQIQQTLQALPTNFVQQLQAFQYQMQAKQMQQQQHGGGQGQHGHGQQQTVQGLPPPPPTTTTMPHQQQQQQQQKHQNQHQQQQQQNALSRYLSAAAAQAAAASGNKMSSVTPPPPPPLTNQMKPPNLPPNTQITPVSATSMAGGNISAGPHPKMSTGNANIGNAKHPGPPPSISLTPSKSSSSGPSVAHQQNKFTPPTNSGHKGVHMGHSQNLPKSTHGATHTATSNTTSPAKTGTNADATVAALKSPQSTPVQLTKQMPPMANTAGMSNKTLASATTTATATATASASAATATITTEATPTNVTPIKATTATTAITALASTAANAVTTSLAVGLTNTTTTTTAAAASTAITTTNATSTKSAVGEPAKPAPHDSAVTKLPLKSAIAEKETLKTSSNDAKDPVKVSTTAPNAEGTKKETEIPKDKKLESEAAVDKASVPETSTREPAQESNESKCNSAKNASGKAPATVVTTLESKATEKKLETSEKSKADNHDSNENEKKLTEDKKGGGEKNKPATTEDKSSASATSKTPAQEPVKQPLSPRIDVKKATSNLNQTKASLEENKLESKEKSSEKESDKDKAIKTNKSLAKVEQLESAETKDTQKAATVAEKSLIAAEAKSSPLTTAQTVPPIKSLKREETNIRNSVEGNIKKDASESESCKKEEKQTVTAAEKVDSSKSPAIVAESKKDQVAKEDAESLRSIKSNDKSETTSSAVKPPLSQTAAKITNTDDSVKDSVLPITQKEAVATEATPIKKLGRFSKGAKSKSIVVTTPVGNKAAESQEDKPSASSARAKRKPKADNSHISDSAPSTPKNDDADRKSKRHRLKTILYQSPLPELAYITKLSASEASNSPKPMSNEDRLIVFYKNEYMAVRNAEGTFYLCQTMQNVYRTSPRISIRWLSEDAKDNNVFIPDFYDHTDIECVLTTVDLKRIDKGHLRLPKGERNRIESILKKAIDVEKGLVPRPELTEENPDGLDISLFKDESQIEKKSALPEGGDSQTPSIASGRKPRRAAIAAASSTRRSFANAATPSTSSGNKRKRNSTSAATSASNSRKTLTKKRKTLVKRKKKIGTSDDDDEESSDDYESDAEYKPTQKRSSLNASGVSKSAPRAQRSPLAKARAASPITPTTSRSKIVPQKTVPTPTPSTSKASRGERAAKRKSLVDAGSSEEAAVPAKKPTTTSNNKSKADKPPNEAAPVKNSSLNDNINVSSS